MATTTTDGKLTDWEKRKERGARKLAECKEVTDFYGRWISRVAELWDGHSYVCPGKPDRMPLLLATHDKPRVYFSGQIAGPGWLNPDNPGEDLLAWVDDQIDRMTTFRARLVDLLAHEPEKWADRPGYAQYSWDELFKAERRLQREAAGQEQPA